MIEALVQLLILALVIGVVFWLVDYCIAQIPAAQPFKTVARVILAVAAIIVLLAMVLRILPMAGVG